MAIGTSRFHILFILARKKFSRGPQPVSNLNGQGDGIKILYLTMSLSELQMKLILPKLQGWRWFQGCISASHAKYFPRSYVYVYLVRSEVQVSIPSSLKSSSAPFCSLSWKLIVWNSCAVSRIGNGLGWVLTTVPHKS